MTIIKGLTQEETDALRCVLALAMGGDRVARQSRKFMDGDPAALADATKTRQRLAEACAVIKAAHA